jgi:hypothetical protein
MNHITTTYRGITVCEQGAFMSGYCQPRILVGPAIDNKISTEPMFTSGTRQHMSLLSVSILTSTTAYLNG